MLNIKRSKSLAMSLPKKAKYYFSHYQLAVQDIRAKYLLVVQDKKGQLQYMRQVQTEDGKRGIVLKIQQPFHTYIAFYEPLAQNNYATLKLKNKNVAWQESVNLIFQQILSKNNSPSIYNINGHKIYSSSKKIETSQLSNDRKLHSFSPILDISYDLRYGDMINFAGCLGSRKTTTSLNLASIFSKNSKHASIYINTSSPSQGKRAVDQFGCWNLEAGSPKNQTDVGVYMLAAKTVHLASLLSKAGQDTLLIFDGFRHVLQAQWHMVQLLNSSKKNQKQSAFKAPRLPPISILNQIYAFSSDNTKNNKQGSLSAIITTENKTNDELMPQVTPYSNNIKHLESLSKKIQFPLVFKHSPLNKVTNRSQNQDSPALQECQAFIRNKINQYLIEKKETELKRRLYKTDMKDAPWDYFQMLDAEWWMKALQNSKVTSQSEMESLLTWIMLNIEMQLVAHWKVSCQQAFKSYKDYLGRQSLKIGRNSLQNFTTEAKLQGIFSPFKKDYLN